MGNATHQVRGLTFRSAHAPTGSEREYQTGSHSLIGLPQPGERVATPQG